MKEYVVPVQLRWADLDPNFHLRHSVYYDWGAMCRVNYLYKIGLTAEIMLRHHFGPILFREECLFKKEIRPDDQVTVDFRVSRARKDFSRWSVQHTFRKYPDIIAAILTVDIAWIDTIRRKLATLPEEVQQMFSKFPVTDDFQWSE